MFVFLSGLFHIVVNTFSCFCQNRWMQFSTTVLQCLITGDRFHRHHSEHSALHFIHLYSSPSQATVLFNTFVSLWYKLYLSHTGVAASQGSVCGSFRQMLLLSLSHSCKQIWFLISGLKRIFLAWLSIMLVLNSVSSSPVHSGGCMSYIF